MKMKKTALNSFVIIILFFFTALAFSQEFVKEAREYRQKGYQAQQAGDIELAIVYYKKAIALDPHYAVPHNDLGIAYETKGLLDKAEQEYLIAIRINPDFAEAHMNLALLYENMNKIDQAIPHFIKRVELGNPNDPWTKKAWEKLWKYAPKQAKEVEAKILAQEVARKIQEQKGVKKVAAEKHFQKGMFFFEKGLFEDAYKEFKQAVVLVPDDKKYQEMYKKADFQYRLSQINLHYKNGIDYYKKNDFTNAKQEFEKIIELIPREE